MPRFQGPNAPEDVGERGGDGVPDSAYRPLPIVVVIRFNEVGGIYGCVFVFWGFEDVDASGKVVVVPGDGSGGFEMSVLVGEGDGPN